MIFSSRLIEDTVTQFAKLPGIGKKTALRLVLHLLKQDQQEVTLFSETMDRMRKEIRYCSRCHNVSDDTLCRLCADSSRRKNQVCVVESIRDVMAIESTQQYSGLYHVLGGVISPLDGIGPDNLSIASLLQRLEDESIEELIFALSPTMEGDTTTYFITRKLNKDKIKLTAISRGIAFGGELEYTDELTLARSIQNRLPLEHLSMK